MKLQIDVKPILQQVAAAAQQGEDTDVAILRACKALYPEHHSHVFPAVAQMVETMARQRGTSAADAARHLAGSTASCSLTLETASTATPVCREEVQDLSQLPPQFRGRVEQALASGQSTVTVTAESHTTTTATGGVPPDLQKMLDDAMASGKGEVTIETQQDAPPPAAPQPTFLCRHCGYAEPGDFDRCPHCGRSQRGSLLARLFGR